MNIEIVKRSSGVIMRVSGSLNFSAAQSFAKACYELLKIDTQQIALDLREITYMGSASVCTIVAVGKLVQARDGKYCLALSNSATKAMKFGGFDTLFPIVDNPEDVIE